MNINPERFPTYKPLSPVLRTQTTYIASFVVMAHLHTFLRVEVFGKLEL